MSDLEIKIRNHMIAIDNAYECEIMEYPFKEFFKLIDELLEVSKRATPIESGKNRYGVDVAYFRKTINRELNRPLSDFRSDELARVFARLSVTADSKVIHEPEFQRSAEVESE